MSLVTGKNSFLCDQPYRSTFRNGASAAALAASFKSACRL
jgi:hypothetical protein